MLQRICRFKYLKLGVQGAPARVCRGVAYHGRRHSGAALQRAEVLMVRHRRKAVIAMRFPGPAFNSWLTGIASARCWCWRLAAAAVAAFLQTSAPRGPSAARISCNGHFSVTRSAYTR